MKNFLVIKYIVIIIVYTLSVSAIGQPSTSTTWEDYDIVKGITISTHRIGLEWADDNIVPTIKEIKDIGANWVTIHPYALISRDGSIRYHGADSSKAPEHWVRPIREAHKKGLKICIKPHLSHWRAGFSWRGEITFKEKEAWANFWRGYSKWIIHLVSVCKDADGFVIGTELDKTLGFENEWRKLIKSIRGITNKPLTYAANWTYYQKVPFWDALDVIGIQAYFPIANNSDPTKIELQKGWKKRMKEISIYGQTKNRKILFTELGYNQSFLAAKKPWDSHTDGESANWLQETCLQVALEAIHKEPSVVGTMLWKWFPHPNPVGRNFQLASPRIKNILRSFWKNFNSF